jgi:hypothetical protein
MKIKDLGNKFAGHTWLSIHHKHTMVLEPIDGIVYYMVCPLCGDNKDLRHYNYYSSKMLNEPLKIECQRCGEVHLRGDMNIEILNKK